MSSRYGLFSIKPIVARKLWNAVNFEGAVTAALKEHLEEVKKEFLKTVDTWETKVTFVIEIKKFSGRIYTASDIYHMVDAGTKPHRIPKSGTTRLVFQWQGAHVSYVPKSIPGYVGSQGGGSSGPVVRMKWVDHPGTLPRLFGETIETQLRPKLEIRLQRYIEDAINKGLGSPGAGL